MEIPQGVYETVKKLQEAGYEAYIVGGAVRDVLLGLTPQDWDVATSALPVDVMRLFPKTVPTGLKFGTVTVIAERPIEVTTFRQEGRYLDGRKPSDVRLGVTLQEDLSRRDFTINAIAYDPVTGQYVDPFRGRDDLANGQIPNSFPKLSLIHRTCSKNFYLNYRGAHKTELFPVNERGF